MRARQVPILIAILAGCSADEHTAADAVDVDTDAPADVAPDTVTTDTVAPDTQVPDTTPADTADDAATDSAVDTTPSDTTPDGTVIALPGARCALSERIGIVQLDDQGTTPSTFYLVAAIDDRPSPFYGAPELTTASCEFHRFAPAHACPPCAEDELCGISGDCTKAPLRHTDTRVTLSAGAEQQVFDADPQSGDVFGPVTLSGSRFALEVTFAGERITLVASDAPGALDALAGTLAGGYDAPTALDLSWSTSAVGTHAHTLIAINHHAGAPTFTECTVPATAGSLHVDEDMLMPLAVITGLEFQGLEHVRFAAAETPAGCVEIRYSLRHYVNL